MTFEQRNSNARGRITGMAGTETTVKLDPTRLSAKMRNSVIRMIETMTVTGGWAAQSRRLAEVIIKNHTLPCTVTTSRGIRVVGLTEEAAPRIREVVVADWAAFLLLNPSYRNGYYKNSYDREVDKIDELDQDFYIGLNDTDSIRKVAAILGEHITPETKARALRVADKLRGTEPIHIINFRN